MNRKVAAIEGARLSLSNLEKDLYPSYGFTKAQVLEYYRRVSPCMLPHLRGRALTLKRYPEGVEKEYFFEKRCPSYHPSWITTARIPQSSGAEMTVCLVNDLNTLMWVENLASLELHVPLARADSVETPDSVVFDLDPGDGAEMLHCIRAALTIRDLLDQLQLVSYVKTSGKKGLHVYVPLNLKGTTFAETKTFSKAVAEVLQHNYPDLITAKMDKNLRKGKVFINWSQNDSKKTMVCVYSLRAGREPTVSFPLSWREVEALAGQDSRDSLRITYSEAIRRTEKEGDLFQGLLTRRQRLPNL